MALQRPPDAPTLPYTADDSDQMHGNPKGGNFS